MACYTMPVNGKPIGQLEAEYWTFKVLTLLNSIYIYRNHS